MLDIRHTETQLQEYLEKQKQRLGCKVCTHYCIGFAGAVYRLTCVTFEMCRYVHAQITLYTCTPSDMVFLCSGHYLLYYHHHGISFWWLSDFCSFWPRLCCVNWYYPFFYHLFTGYPENAKYPPDNNCISCSRHKIVWKLAYLGVRITLLFLKHKIVRKVSCFWCMKIVYLVQT